MAVFANIIFEIENDIKSFNEKLLCLFESQKNHLTKDLQSYLFSGSKRIRSLLIFLFSRAMGFEVNDEIINLACATELIHNSTLIHDDIIDDSNLRRNSITLNYKFDNKLAVIAGDFLLSLAMGKLVELKNVEIMDIFSESLIKMCDGEIEQYFEKNKIPDIKEYIEKSNYKTAKLFEAALLSVLTIFDCGKYSNNIKNFAINFGIAFQIRDDLLNVISKSDSKPFLNDIENGVYTAPLILLSKYNPDLNFKDTEMLEINLKNHNIIDETRELISCYINNALDSIEFIGDNQYKTKIIELCNFINEAKEH